MAVTFAAFTSNPGLLACQLSRLEDQVALTDGTELDVVGVGSYAQDDVLLQRHAAAVLPATLGQILPPDASEALLYQAQGLPATASLEASAQPFRFRRWLFTFDGHLEGFEAFREGLWNTLPPYLQRQIGVESQGEAAFSVFLKHLRDAGRTDDKGLDAPLAAALLGKTLTELMDLSARAGAVLASEFQLVASNSQLLVAGRMGRPPLYYRLLEGSDRCEACGLDPADPRLKPVARAHQMARAVAVASQLRPGAHWLELPSGSVVGVGASLAPFTLPA